MSDDRPNIIFIITDQQRFDTIRELGFDYMKPPTWTDWSERAQR